MLNFFKKKPIMEFYCHDDDFQTLPQPKPAGKFIPEWYKKIPQFINDGRNDRDAFGATTMTAKKCMPMLDVMTMGYVLPLSADLHVKSNHDCSTIEVTSSPNIEVCQFHDIRQIGERTAPGFPAPPLKFINPWIVKTAPGWSTLFTPLMNNFEQRFTCLSGLVDTDTYCKPVNFPAVWHIPDHDDLIPAGTPLILAIPVKRSAINEKAVIRTITPKEQERIRLITKMQDTRRGVYTHELREPRK